MGRVCVNVQSYKMDPSCVGAQESTHITLWPTASALWTEILGGAFLSARPRGRLDMRSTCNYCGRISKMIQIRNVPDEIHRVLKLRAVQAGMTLSDYLLKEVTAVAQRTTVEELPQRIRRRGAAQPGEDSVEAVRAERDGRG